MFGSTFIDQTVLVTGLAGAKGTWIGWYLLQAGVEKIVGIDLASNLQPTAFVRSGLADHEKVHLHDVDVRNTDDIVRIIEEHEPFGAIHLAGMAIVGECRKDPLRAYSVNTLGTASFVESVRRTGLSRTVIITTDKVYRDTGGRAWRETDPLVQTGPYAVSKACADFIARDYYSQYLHAQDQSLAVARAGNVLAPGDHHQGRIYVDVAYALADERPPVILNPLYTRPYAFVGDTAAGYLSLLALCDKPDVAGEAFNFGPSDQKGTPNGELATKMCEMWGTDIVWTQGDQRPEPFEHQSLDSTRAAERLGWRTAWTLDDAVRALVTWYRAERAGASTDTLRSITLDIIDEHTSAARDQDVWWAVS
jgi:CDP-glucose 4,6-dehydratase